MTYYSERIMKWIMEITSDKTESEGKEEASSLAHHCVTSHVCISNGHRRRRRREGPLCRTSASVGRIGNLYIKVVRMRTKTTTTMMTTMTMACTIMQPAEIREQQWLPPRRLLRHCAALPAHWKHCSIIDRALNREKSMQQSL